MKDGKERLLLLSMKSGTTSSRDKADKAVPSATGSQRNVPFACQGLAGIATTDVLKKPILPGLSGCRRPLGELVAEHSYYGYLRTAATHD